MSRSVRNRAAIAGIGQTEFSKASGRSEIQLACEAAKAALDDAGLHPRDVDGLVTFTMDSSEEAELARNLGIPTLTMFARVPYGGGAACAVVMQAAMAIATGAAEVVVCYRALNERSGMRFGGAGMAAARLPPWLDWYAPYGLLSPAAWVALHARRYMHEYGVTNEDFGRIAVVDRKHAATNPAAAADGELMTSYYRDDITGLPEMGVVAKKLWAESGLSPADIQTAFLYDHFTPFVLIQIEELGFCGRGEGRDFATIENLSIGGRLPINTSGGLLGEGYIHGMNGITEAVRQIRGTSCNQVKDVEHVLVTAGTGCPTSGLILGRE